MTLTSQTPAQELKCSVVSANYFSVLGVEAALGRTFAAEEGFTTQTRVAIISHALWQRYFGANPQVVGAKIQLEKRDFQIIGVMPRAFKSPAGEADLWLPINFQPNDIDRGQTYLQAIGRLKSEVTLDQAQAESAVSLLTGVLFGLAPALYARRANLNEALKDGGSRHASGGWRRNKLQSAFVVTQVAVALMLLIGAGLLTRSFVQLVNVNPEFHTEGVLVARLFLGREYLENYRQVV